MMIRVQAVRALAVLAFVVCAGARVHAQKTDVVTLGNGDRITGEVKRLDRGRLEFSTDDAGTLHLEWDKLVSVVARRQVEVVTSAGLRYVGSLAPAPPRAIVVATLGGDTSLTMSEVTIIRPIGASFWSRLDGSFGVGFNYTRSSGVAQLNLDSDTMFVRPAFRGRLTASFTQTQTEDSEGRDDRGTIEISYLRYRWQRWFVLAAGRFENNESLGLELRSQFGAAVGPRLINSNRAQLVTGAGLAVNHERGVDVDATQNVEALLFVEWSFFTYDTPKTNLDLNVQYYPSLSNTGRQRAQIDAGINRELWKDFFLAATLYNTFDSRPPTATADRNDVGVVLSIGWTY
jgi:hypothetical protein